MEERPENNVTYPSPSVPYAQVFYPVAADTNGTSSSSQIGSRITFKVNSVIVVPGYGKEEEVGKLTWGDEVFCSESDEDQMDPEP